MSHQIFAIDELLRLVIDELVETSPPTAISFALTCRSLEEPTLSSLWKRQHYITDLVKVLPNHTWVGDNHGIKSIAIEYDPSVENWARLQRYASWMRGLYLFPRGNISRDTFFRISRSSIGGVLFPRLEWLRWDTDETDITPPCLHLCFPPQLRRVILRVKHPIPGTPSDQLGGLIQIISSLPPSLEYLDIVDNREQDETTKNAISAFVCRCGASLRGFQSNVPLSEAAIHHIMQLPSLRSWATVQGPPRTIPVPTFPPLEELRLNEQAAVPWLHLFASHEGGVLQNGSTPATSHANIKETLRTFSCPRNTILDSTLLSSILEFRNLVTLHTDIGCYQAKGCSFHLTNDNIENLAATLPRLECLQLGPPCHSNSCAATVASLLSISTRCLGLTVLETHFNTLTIVGDMRHLLNEGSGQDKVKCILRDLTLGFLPLDVGGEDIQIVATGFRAIFPCLMHFTGYSFLWGELGSRLGG